MQLWIFLFLFFAKSSFKRGGENREGGYQSSRTCSAKGRLSSPLPPPPMPSRHRLCPCKMNQTHGKTDGLSKGKLPFSALGFLKRERPAGVEKGDLYPPRNFTLHDASGSKRKLGLAGGPRIRLFPAARRLGTRSSWKRNRQGGAWPCCKEVLAFSLQRWPVALRWGQKAV